MANTNDIKDNATVIIEMIKQLPKDKQEYVRGYIQGVADATKNKSA